MLLACGQHKGPLDAEARRLLAELRRGAGTEQDTILLRAIGKRALAGIAGRRNGRASGIGQRDAHGNPPKPANRRSHVVGRKLGVGWRGGPARNRRKSAQNRKNNAGPDRAFNRRGCDQQT